MSTLSDSDPTVHDCHADAGVPCFPGDFDFNDYNAYLDELDAKRALLEDGPTEPQASYMPGISIQGRRFAAFVRTSDGRTIKCGTWPTEAQAWAAADRKISELTRNVAA